MIDLHELGLGRNRPLIQWLGKHMAGDVFQQPAISIDIVSIRVSVQDKAWAIRKPLRPACHTIIL
jgi:hypothetical protein